MKLKNITPGPYDCVCTACPAIYENPKGDKLIIVGSKVNSKELGIDNRIGENEQAVTVDREMLRQVFEK